ncbi:Cygnin [Struthio camelus australis]|uniref:Cygnin n=1 Tax=Struthio camelus australis TaxID=441894 RepID=A0A093HC58_STRCA|nr:Cygnin [Struthio camelus australis]
MRFLYLVFAVFLLVSLATPGYGQIKKYCPKHAYCSRKCSKGDSWSLSSDCKYYCCVPYGWKEK